MLKPILAQDIRKLTGIQPYVKQAPVSLIYVADTVFIIENVYLYCAAEGLPTTVRTAIDKPALAKTMKLRPDQKITLVRAVTYPKKEHDHEICGRRCFLLCLLLCPVTEKSIFRSSVSEILKRFDLPQHLCSSYNLQ